jgi:hypothetical protein
MKHLSGKGPTAHGVMQKEFKALKKKVLQERMDKWRELHPETAPESNSAKGGKDTFTKTPFYMICIYNETMPEEIMDDDEYEEIVENLKAMATKVGPVTKILVPRELQSGDNADDDKNSILCLSNLERKQMRQPRRKVGII